MVSVSQMQQGTGRGEGGAFTLLDIERAVCRPASLTPQPQCVFLQILWLSAFGTVGLLRAGKGKWQVPGARLWPRSPPSSRPPKGRPRPPFPTTDEEAEATGSSATQPSPPSSAVTPPPDPEPPAALHGHRHGSGPNRGVSWTLQGTWDPSGQEASIRVD